MAQAATRRARRLCSGAAQGAAAKRRWTPPRQRLGGSAQARLVSTAAATSMQTWHAELPRSLSQPPPPKGPRLCPTATRPGGRQPVPGCQKQHRWRTCCWGCWPGCRRGPRHLARAQPLRDRAGNRQSILWVTMEAALIAMPPSLSWRRASLAGAGARRLFCLGVLATGNQHPSGHQPSLLPLPCRHAFSGT